MFAEAGAAEPVGRFRSQRRVRSTMKTSIAEVDGIWKIEKVLVLTAFSNSVVS